MTKHQLDTKKDFHFQHQAFKQFKTCCQKGKKIKRVAKKLNKNCGAQALPQYSRTIFKQQP